MNHHHVVADVVVVVNDISEIGHGLAAIAIRSGEAAIRRVVVIKHVTEYLPALQSLTMQLSVKYLAGPGQGTYSVFNLSIHFTS